MKEMFWGKGGCESRFLLYGQTADRKTKFFFQFRQIIFVHRTDDHSVNIYSHQKQIFVLAEFNLKN